VQQSFTEKVGKYNSQGREEWAGEVAQEYQCLGLDEHLYNAKGEQVEIWVVQSSGFW
jgi:hypothetical protein